MRTSPSDRIIAIASDLFFREGIRAVGIDRIIDEADVAKATLYRHFPSKEDLVLAYLEKRHAAVIAGLDEVRSSEVDPRRQIEAIFTRLYEKAANADFRGCAFALAVAENGQSPRVVDLARFHKRTVEDVLVGIAASSGVQSSAALGAHLALLYDGALARRAVTGDAQVMLEAKASALFAFDNSFGPIPSKVN